MINQYVTSEVPTEIEALAPSQFPDLVKVAGRWTIVPFKPGMTAYEWSKCAGKVGTLYVIECAGFLKLGLTQDFERRFVAIDCGNPLPIRRVATRKVPLAGLAFAEKWLHDRFKDRRVKGEWFAITEAEALAALPMAVRRADAYARCCAEWDRAEEEKAIARRALSASQQAAGSAPSWPEGCIKRSSCGRNHMCMYGGMGRSCPHTDRSIKDEVDALPASPLWLGEAK